MMDEMDKIEVFYNENQLAQAEALIEELMQIDDRDEGLYLWQGKIHYKKEEWGKAINSFNKVLEINSNNKYAQSQIDMAKTILGFFTPDMFNP